MTARAEAPDPARWSFPADTADFLRDLRAHNDRDWFAASKSRYETAFKRPAETFRALATPPARGVERRRVDREDLPHPP